MSYSLKILKFKDWVSTFLGYSMPWMSITSTRKKSIRILSHLDLDKDPVKNRSASDLSVGTKTIDSSGDFIILAHASSFIRENEPYLNLSSFYVGYKNPVQRMTYESRTSATILTGSFLVISIFYMFIFAFRRKDLSSAYLSIYAFLCFCMALFYCYPHDFSNKDVRDYFKILNVSSIGFLQLYLLRKISFIFTANLLRVLNSLALVIPFLATAFTFSGIEEASALFTLLTFGSSFALITGTVIVGFKYRISGIWFLVVAATGALIFQTRVMAVSVANSNEEFGFGVLIANCIMAVGLALVNAKEFAETYRKTQAQSLDLEEKIDKSRFSIKTWKNWLIKKLMKFDPFWIIYLKVYSRFLMVGGYLMSTQSISKKYWKPEILQARIFRIWFLEN